jgi:hypothetical protein
VIEDTDTYVQTLNDRFTNPSGDERPVLASSTPEAVSTGTE